MVHCSSSARARAAVEAHGHGREAWGRLARYNVEVPPLLATLALLSIGLGAPGYGAAQSRLETEVAALIASSGAEVAVAMRTLDGRDELLIRPDVSFHAASTMKVPVMIELFNQARNGRVRLEDPLPVINEFHSIVDGSPYVLGIEDDSDVDVYSRIGKTMSLQSLCEAMITVSSNFATNLLIEHLGVARIRQTVTALDARGMQVLRGVEDGKAFERGLSNTTTARALLTLFTAIATGTAVDAASSREMVEILKRQQFNDSIPAGLPAGTPVAHKTGSITRINHDAAIVYAQRPYVLTILVRGIDDHAESAALMSEISRRVHDAMAR